MFRHVFRILSISITRSVETRYCLKQNAKKFNPNGILSGHQIRNYAKGKNKLKEDKGKGKKKVEINEGILGEVINVEKMKGEFVNCIEKMKNTYSQQLVLRSTTGALENLRVHFEGHKYTLIELGYFNNKNPKNIIINMTSYPQAIPSVMKAISESGMNLNPQQDGTSISVPMPRVTKELRENLVKSAKAYFFKSRDEIRQIQTKYLKMLKRQERDGLSEDMSYNISEQIKYLGDSYISEAEKILKNKENELLSTS